MTWFATLMSSFLPENPRGKSNLNDFTAPIKWLILNRIVGMSFKESAATIPGAYRRSNIAETVNQLQCK
jgi:hypothetical protein